MATYEEVIQALRNADAAGDAQSARRLAVIADGMKPTKSSGVMPQVNKAIAEGLGFIPDIAQKGIQKGLNLIPGVNLPEPFSFTDTIKSGMRAIGASPAEQEPQTVSENIGQGIGEVAGMLIPGGAAFKGLAKGTGTAGRIASSIWSSMVKHPYIGMGAEVTAGAGSGIGRSVPETPTGKAAGSIIGGVIGGAVPTTLTYSPTMVGLRYGKAILRKLHAPFTKPGATYRAGEFIKGQVASPEKAIEGVTKETIADLPPVVASGEKKLMTFYKAFIGQDPIADAESIESMSNSMIKLEGEMRKMGYGSPELLAEITKKRVAAIELRIDNRILETTTKAQKKLEALPVAKRMSTESEVVRSELEKVMYEELDNAKELWLKVPKDYKVKTGNTIKTFNTINEDLAVAQKIDVPVSLRKSPILETEETTIREMQGLRSKLLEEARIARKNGKWNRARIAEDVSDAILEDVGISAQGASTPEAADLQAALAATRHNKVRFETGVVGKILGYDKSGAPAIDPSLTLDVSIGREGLKGAVDINKVVVTPEAKKATEKYLARSFTDYAAKEGSVNPSKANNWIKSNEEILDEFPSLRKQLSDVSSSQKIADDTRIKMEARKKAIQDPRISNAARFLNRADMNSEVDSLFKSTTPIRQVDDLMLKAAKDKTGNAIEGLRGGVIDYMLEKSNVGAYNELGEQSLSGNTLMHFINSNKDVIDKVFTQDQIKRMRAIGSELSKIEMFEKAHPAKMSEIEMKDFASGLLKLSGRVGGAQLGRWVAKITGGGTVQTPGIFSERFKAFAQYLSKDKAVQMIHDAILSKDPALLKALLGKIEKPNGKLNVENLKILDARMNLWLSGEGVRLMKDIKEENGEQK